MRGPRPILRERFIYLAIIIMMAMFWWVTFLPQRLDTLEVTGPIIVVATLGIMGWRRVAVPPFVLRSRLGVKTPRPILRERLIHLAVVVLMALCWWVRYLPDVVEGIRLTMSVLTVGVMAAVAWRNSFVPPLVLRSRLEESDEGT